MKKKPKRRYMDSEMMDFLDRSLIGSFRAKDGKLVYYEWQNDDLRKTLTATMREEGKHEN